MLSTGSTLDTNPEQEAESEKSSNLEVKYGFLNFNEKFVIESISHVFSDKTNLNKPIFLNTININNRKIKDVTKDINELLESPSEEKMNYDGLEAYFKDTLKKTLVEDADE